MYFTRSKNICRITTEKNLGQTVRDEKLNLQIY